MVLSHFLGQKGKPQPLKPDETKRFLGDFDGTDGPFRTTEAAPYKIGDSVKLQMVPLWIFQVWFKKSIMIRGNLKF